MISIKTIVLPMEQQDRGIRYQILQEFFECVREVAQFKSVPLKLKPLLQERKITLRSVPRHGLTARLGCNWEIWKTVGRSTVSLTLYDSPSEDIPGLLAIADAELEKWRPKEQLEPEVYLHRLEEAVEYQFGDEMTSDEFRIKCHAVADHLEMLARELRAMKADDHTPEGRSRIKEAERLRTEAAMREWEAEKAKRRVASES